MRGIAGGRERTKEEFAILFTRAGLRLARPRKTATAPSVLEAAAAERREGIPSPAGSGPG